MSDVARDTIPGRYCWACENVSEKKYDGACENVTNNLTLLERHPWIVCCEKCGMPASWHLFTCPHPLPSSMDTECSGFIPAANRATILTELNSILAIE